MKRIALLFCILSAHLLICSSLLSQQADSSKKIPPANRVRSPQIDIKHIIINLRFDWQKKQAYGKTAITFSPNTPTNTINLDAGMLTIHSIVLLNGTILTYNYDGGDTNGRLEIILDRTYAPTEEITVQVDYHTNHVNTIDPNNLSGSNGKGLRFSKPTSNDPLKPREIWSMGDPESNRYWFPSYDAPNDLRTTEFIATVDKALTVISNGNLIERKNNVDRTHTFHYKTNTPYANHLTSFVAGEYTELKQNYHNITLRSFGYPTEKESVAATIVRLPDMIKYFSEVTGVKYPYPGYSQVFVQDIGSFSGNNMVSTITENMVDDYGTHADFFYLWDLTEAEALAQQWFGNYITSKHWSDAWLSKSLAHYFSELYCEQKNGRDEFLLYPYSVIDQAIYFSDWNAGYRHPVVTPHYGNAFDVTGDNYTTFRGSLVLHMLRKHLGEENWWKAIKRYVKANAHKTVSTEDFQKAVEEAAGEKMDWFFDQWIYKMGHPVFEVTKKYFPTTKQLKLYVKQIQKIDSTNSYPQVLFFKGKIDIEMDGRIERVWLEPQAENTFTFTNTQEPKFINFDYENTWIKEVIFEKSFDELLYQIQNSKDILGRQSAITELVAIAKKEETAAFDKEKIKTAFRNIIASNAYWRLRASAMVQLRSLFGPDYMFEESTIAVFLKIIKDEQSWLKASAINSLGMTKKEKYVDIYLTALNDKSDRVINAAAIALGKTKSKKAFAALAKLVNKPSMKSQSLLSALSGFQELGDPRGFDIAFKALSNAHLPRWRLPNGSIWDYRIFAAQTIALLGKSADAYPLIFDRFKKSMQEDDLDGMLNNILLINVLADPRGQEAFDILKKKYKEEANVLTAITEYEKQFTTAIKKQ